MPSRPSRFLPPSGSSRRRAPSPSDLPPISPASLLGDSTSSLINPQLHTHSRHPSQNSPSSPLRVSRGDEPHQRTPSSHHRPADLTPTLDVRPSADGSGRNVPPTGRGYMKRPIERPAEMVTGPCVCCASTVRWPEGLSQFRCSICKTVNTVKYPAQPIAAQEGVGPLSIDTVRDIVEQSKRNFFGGIMSKNLTEKSPTNDPSNEKRSVSPDISGSSPQKSSDSEGPDATTGMKAPSINYNQQRPMYIKLAVDSFAPLEEYVQNAFSSWQCLNNSFVPGIRMTPGLPTVEPASSPMPSKGTAESGAAVGGVIPALKSPNEKEAATLNLEQSTRQERGNTSSLSEKLKDRKSRNDRRIPPIDWKATQDFYDHVLSVGVDAIFDLSFYQQSLSKSQDASLMNANDMDLGEIERALHEARVKVLTSMLQAAEALLKRPGRPLNMPEDIRFLLILLANPLLSPGSAKLTTSRIPSTVGEDHKLATPQDSKEGALTQPKTRERLRKTGGPGHNSFLLKRIYGLLSNLTNECHRYIISWTSIAPSHIFRELVEVAGSFTTYRIHQSMSKKHYRGRFPYSEDWQLKAVARVMTILEKANNDVLGKRSRYVWSSRDNTENKRTQNVHLVPVNLFYNMRLDYLDIVDDFEAWERRESKFCFCQYPFYLSMGAKASIIDHDSKRQMETRARSAFISNISARTAFSAYMNLKVRRDCIIEDSLKGISESVGTLDEHKKGLKVEFVGEDGIDAGGLRKEWFLILAREIFDPRYGLFICEEDSNYCYFNPHSLESSEEFYLVGVLLGLAIYNSTILDVPLPPYLFRKLVANPPYPNRALEKNHDKNFHRRESPPLRRTLADLAVIRPALARGLQQLLEFEGDVESTFCRNFVFEDDRYGEKTLIDLGTNGNSKPVTNENRQEFVDRYIKHILDDAVQRQFDPFRRGFYTVCGGNALGLLGPEELELIIRGSAEPLDVHALKAVAIYEGFGPPAVAEQDTVVKWFWSFFEKTTPEQQRMLLSFITGSDRIPATGATSLIIKIACIGRDCDRFPVARTCFNQICLYRYKRRDKFEAMLWRAVTESEGFGLK